MEFTRRYYRVALALYENRSALQIFGYQALLENQIAIVMDHVPSTEPIAEAPSRDKQHAQCVAATQQPEKPFRGSCRHREVLLRTLRTHVDVLRDLLPKDPENTSYRQTRSTHASTIVVLRKQG